MNDAADKPTPTERHDATRTATPFIVASVVAVLVIVGIVLLSVLRPVGKNDTDSDLIALAVRNFAVAQSQSEGDRAANTCLGFDPAKSPLGPGAVGKKVDIVNVTGSGVTGDRAQATVTSRVDGHESTSIWNLTRTDKFWRVCSG
jgi:hypothetical protein